MQTQSPVSSTDATQVVGAKLSGATAMRSFSLYLNVRSMAIKVGQGVQFENGWCSLCFKYIVTSPYCYKSISEVNRAHSDLILRWDEQRGNAPSQEDNKTTD